MHEPQLLIPVINFHYSIVSYFSSFRLSLSVFLSVSHNKTHKHMHIDISRVYISFPLSLVSANFTEMPRPNGKSHGKVFIIFFSFQALVWCLARSPVVEIERERRRVLNHLQSKYGVLILYGSSSGRRRKKKYNVIGIVFRCDIRINWTGYSKSNLHFKIICVCASCLFSDASPRWFFCDVGKRSGARNGKWNMIWNMYCAVRVRVCDVKLWSTSLWCNVAVQRLI